MILTWFDIIHAYGHLSFWPNNKILNNINVTSAGVTLVSILSFLSFKINVYRLLQVYSSVYIIMWTISYVA